MAVKLILARHGQSTWNQENLFTGWRDVDLSDLGRREAQDAGRMIREEGLTFDVAFTSVLKRAIRTLWIIMDETDRMWVPVTRAWQLNERHYGSLQGLNKAEMTRLHGAEQVLVWRRSYDVPPPPLAESDPHHPSHDPRYASAPADRLPSCESLKDTLERVLPYWQTEIAPLLKRGRNVLVAAHGNSLRALVKHLEGISNDAIVGLNIPTGIPRVYTLDDDLRVRDARYLGDPEAAKAAAEAVAKQAVKG